MSEISQLQSVSLNRLRDELPQLLIKDPDIAVSLSI